MLQSMERTKNRSRSLKRLLKLCMAEVISY